jgi:hypothetical protein
MRSTLLVALVAASALALAGCGSSSGGGTGGAGGGTGGAGGGTGGAGGGTGGAGGGAGGGGQAGAGGSTDCNPPCTGQTVCVGSGVEGGVLVFPGDGGVCPSGRHLQGNTCASNLTYACEPIPSGCNGTVTCSCASASLCTSQQICSMLGANEITCVLAAP